MKLKQLLKNARDFSTVDQNKLNSIETKVKLENDNDEDLQYARAIIACVDENNPNAILKTLLLCAKAKIKTETTLKLKRSIMELTTTEFLNAYDKTKFPEFLGDISDFIDKQKSATQIISTPPAKKTTTTFLGDLKNALLNKKNAPSNLPAAPKQVPRSTSFNKPPLPALPIKPVEQPKNTFIKLNKATSFNSKLHKVKKPMKDTDFPVRFFIAKLKQRIYRKKLKISHPVMMSIYQDFIDERNKRTIAETELAELNHTKNTDSVLQKMQHDLTALYSEYLDALVEDIFYDFIYDLTSHTLDEKTQKGIKTHIHLMHEAYKGLNQRIVFDEPLVPSEDSKHFYEKFFIDQELDGLTSRTKDVLQPSSNGPDYKTSAMKDANKKCSTFFLLTMKRIHCLEETSTLHKLAKRSLAGAAKENKKLILDEAKKRGEKMLQEYAERLALNGPTAAPAVLLENKSVIDNPNQLFKAAAEVEKDKVSSYKDYASYVISAIQSVVGQYNPMRK